MKNIIDYFFDEEEKELINKYVLFALLTVVALIFNISAIITGTLYHDIANKSNSEVFIC